MKTFCIKICGILIGTITMVALSGCPNGGSGGSGGNSGGQSNTGGSGSGSGSGTGSSQPGAFTLVSVSMRQNETNVPRGNFSVTYTFSNPIDPTLAQQDINASTSDTVVSLSTDDHGNEPIKVSVSGNTMTVTTLDPTRLLWPADFYTLTVQTTLQDTSGQSLEYSDLLKLSFQTQDGVPRSKITLTFHLDNLSQNYSLTTFEYSYGTASQASGTYVAPNANYNIHNLIQVDGINVNPPIPTGYFQSMPFTYDVYDNFMPGYTYYFAMKVCAPPGTQGLKDNCSPYSDEAHLSL